MNKNRRIHFVLLTTLLTFTMACVLLDQLIPTQAPPPTEAPAVPTDEPTQAVPDSTATEEPEPTPTETPPNNGQILYVSGGNIWRYLVDRGETTQLTSDGLADSYENAYNSPLFSADGRYASYMLNGVSFLHNLQENTVVSLPVRIIQWSNSDPSTFYAASGTFECPAVEDLEDQTEINFDLLRYDVTALESPTLIVNVAGGLFFPQSLSNDEQYASIMHCACYSECGGATLHHLPSNSVIVSPPDLFPGEIHFSPDGSRLATSPFQIYGYFESALYLANSDFSGVFPLYSAPNIAVVNPRWSPLGDWIAFTAYDIADEMTLSDTRVMIINLDGSVVLEIAASNAEFTDWSPDASQILFHRGTWGSYESFIYDIVSGTTTELPFTASWAEMDWGVLP